jgi:UrcA family protein
MSSTSHAATIRGLGVALICSTVLLSFNPPFAAIDDSDVPRVTVRFGDLDLSKPQGAETLYRRIRSAARQVCAPLDGGDLASKMRARVWTRLSRTPSRRWTSLHCLPSTIRNTGDGNRFSKRRVSSSW